MFKALGTIERAKIDVITFRYQNSRNRQDHSLDSLLPERFGKLNTLKFQECLNTSTRTSFDYSIHTQTAIDY